MEEACAMLVGSDNAGRTVVVTGATSGIGLALSQALARSARTLVIVGRNEERLRTAAATVASRGHAGLELVQVVADLATLGGARSLAERLDRLPKIHALMHNAGVLPSHPIMTSEGFEESFATNHLAPFVLNRLLRQRLMASTPSRIVQARADDRALLRSAREVPVRLPVGLQKAVVQRTLEVLGEAAVRI
jgi:NAD(P)-dependent dehydrogenase (short-subunit alcohol dehydrogenase family)